MHVSYKTVKKYLASLYSRVMFGTPQIFREIEVETCTACNLRCSYCPNSCYDRGLSANKKYMPENVFQRLIDDLARKKFPGGRLSPHFYNEPLLDERLPQLLEYARRKLPNIKISVYSNGILLDMKMYEKLKHAGVNEFVITQHTPQIPPGLKEVLAYNSDSCDRINIIYQKNIADSDDMSNRGGLIEIKNRKVPALCLTPSRKIVVDSAGNVLLCCDDYFSRHSFGNIGEESIFAIWNKPEYRKMRHDLSMGIYQLEMCRKCRGLP